MNKDRSSAAAAAPHGGRRGGAEGERKRLSIYLDAAMHRGLRQLAVDRDSNINAIVVGLIEGELQSAAPKREARS